MHRTSPFSLLCATALALAACAGSDAPARSIVETPVTVADSAAPRPVAAPADSSAAAPTSPAVAAALRVDDSLRAGTPPASAGSEELAAAANAAPAPAIPAARDESAEAILRRAAEAYARVRSLQADFSQVLSVPLLNQTQRGKGELYLRRPDHLLMKFTQPAGDVVVADGQYVWLYYPSTDPKQVVRTSVANGANQIDFQKQFLTNPTERFNATLKGSDTVDGRPAWELLLTPKGQSSFQQVRIWVDKEDAMVRRFEITEQNDSRRRVELSDLRINPELPDRLFEFTPPPGAEVFDH
ncbi:MAG TPA: outer membrane lipoprotein chaperone LolA [Longimicrobiaceae bacterium]|nr:outer membrane lipoprotein chaperone LolA [Longimicrobiaceae bacterium]